MTEPRCEPNGTCLHRCAERSGCLHDLALARVGGRRQPVAGATLMTDPLLSTVHGHSYDLGPGWSHQARVDWTRVLDAHARNEVHVEDHVQIDGRDMIVAQMTPAGVELRPAPVDRTVAAESEPETLIATSTFDPGDPVTRDADPRGPLLEDEDGAPLPHELQRGGAIFIAVARGLFGTDETEPSFGMTPGTATAECIEDVMRALTPILWPILPSNDWDHAVAQPIGPVLTPGRWWRVVDAAGAVWGETSNEQEARAVMRPGDKLQREWVAKFEQYRDVAD